MRSHIEREQPVQPRYARGQRGQVLALPRAQASHLRAHDNAALSRRASTYRVTLRAIYRDDSHSMQRLLAAMGDIPDTHLPVDARHLSSAMCPYPALETRATRSRGTDAVASLDAEECRIAKGDC